MLEIANYSHGSVRRIPSTPTAAFGYIGGMGPERKKRAGSLVGSGSRESFYMDERDRDDDKSRVLDESPLTDIEQDG
jgi:hypothetical protein